jgi:hypothetical protein
MRPFPTLRMHDNSRCKAVRSGFGLAARRSQEPHTSAKDLRTSQTQGPEGRAA